MLRSLGRSVPIEDPRSYVQFIPWAHLKRTDAEVLQRSGMRIEVPFSESMHIHAWVLWRPPNPGFAWNHHVYTEDEVYEYNVLNNWSFPDHYFEDQVVFGVREVDRTDFISELGNYWEAWVSPTEADYIWKDRKVMLRPDPDIDTRMTVR